MPITFSGSPSRITAEDMGGFDIGEALKQGFNLNKQFQEARTMPKKLAEELLAAKLKNKHDETINQFLPRSEEARIGNTEANTGLTNQNTYRQQILNKYLPNSEEARLRQSDASTDLSKQNTYKQQILNKFLPQREPAEIDEIKARGKYYANGGGKGGVGQKDYQNYVQGVLNDNPNLTPAQHQEAIDVIAKGGNQLKDGTPLNPMSFGTQNAFDRAIKSTTTAGQLNTLNSANQAESELEVFTDLANKWRAPYATTYNGKSPQQIIDSFKDDEKSQTQLGELIASNALEFEIAQARNRIAMGQPGITSTNQMMEEAQQHITTKWPRMSAKARSAANEKLNYALKQGLSARNKVGAGAGGLYTRQWQNDLKNPNSNKNNEERKPDGGRYGFISDPQTGERVKLLIPDNEWKEFLKDGGAEHE